MMDKLDIHMINALPMPLIAVFFGGARWPVCDIDVETGMMRVDVCGLLEVTHFGDTRQLIDGDNCEHETDKFYLEAGDR
jgi:hypothetical protein